VEQLENSILVLEVVVEVVVSYGLKTTRAVLGRHSVYPSELQETLLGAIRTSKLPKAESLLVEENLIAIHNLAQEAVIL
jgi:hypothetical protein